MIQTPSGWTATRVRNGLRVLPPEGPIAGEIRYRLRMPLADFDRLLQKKLLPEPGFEPESERAPQSLVTDEGEYAILYTDVGRLQGVRVQRSVGMVFGDDFFNRTSGVALIESQFERFHETVRSLLLTETLILGELRRRVFRYQPPPGWRSACFDFETTWFPPTGAGSLTVWPALPLFGGSAETVDGLVAASTHGGRFAVTHAEPPTPVVSEHGLRGKTWVFRGHLPGSVSVVRVAAVLVDERFVYPIRLEAPAGAEGAVLRDALALVLRTAEPLPTPRRRGPSDSTLAQHWLD